MVCGGNIRGSAPDDANKECGSSQHTGSLLCWTVLDRTPSSRESSRKNYAHALPDRIVTAMTTSHLPVPVPLLLPKPQDHCRPLPKSPTMESVSANPQRCPPDAEDVAEAYYMNTLDHPARVAFEDHYLTCARCASIVARTDEFVRSMRNALRQLRREKRARLGRQALEG
jgi:hypothetical protein